LKLAARVHDIASDRRLLKMIPSSRIKHKPTLPDNKGLIEFVLAKRHRNPIYVAAPRAVQSC